MTLTNYWWLLIWMFAAGGIIAWALPKQPVMVMGKREYRWTMSSAVIFVLPYIIWAGYRKGFGDTETYRKTFRESASSLSQISQAVSDAAKDKGFTFLTVLIKSIVGNSDVIFFMLIAIVTDALYCSSYSESILRTFGSVCFCLLHRPIICRGCITACVNFLR